MPPRYLPRTPRRQERHRLRRVRTGHLLPGRGRHDERNVPGRLVLPDADGESGVPSGPRVPGRVDVPAWDVLPDMERCSQNRR